MKIGTHPIRSGQCFVVAEVAQAHEGSIDAAHRFIENIAGSGVQAVKFQLHITNAECSPLEPWRVPVPGYASRYDYWKAMEFSAEQWRGLWKHAEDLGLVFLCSVFSLEAVDLLESLGHMEAWKVPSGEITNTVLLKRLARLNAPIILSTGMSTPGEVVAAQRLLFGCPVLTLQCTSQYPCPPESWGLNRLAHVDGLSDHSGDIFAGLAAVTLGARVLEVHVGKAGPDAESALTFSDLARLVKGVREIERALAHPIEKAQMAQKLEPMRELFMRKLQRKIEYDTRTASAI